MPPLDQPPAAGLPPNGAPPTPPPMDNAAPRSTTLSDSDISVLAAAFSPQVLSVLQKLGAPSPSPLEGDMIARAPGGAAPPGGAMPPGGPPGGPPAGAVAPGGGLPPPRRVLPRPLPRPQTALGRM